MVSITQFAIGVLALTAPVTARRRRRPCSATSASAAAAATSMDYASSSMATSTGLPETTSVTISRSTYRTASKVHASKAKPTKTEYSTFETKYSTTFETTFSTTFETYFTTTNPAEVTRTTPLGGPYAATPTANIAADTFAHFKPGVTWDICIDNPIKHDSVDVIPQEAKVWDIDLGHANDNPTLIPTLKAAGKFVICYFNAGAVQTWDTDAGQFSSSDIGNTLGGPYTSEHYLDIRSSHVLAIMKKRLDKAVQLGCDAVDPDNTDAWVINNNDPTGFGLAANDYVKYLQNLATYAHSLKTQSGHSLLVGQKNAADNAAALSSILDFAVLEECRGVPNTPDAPFCADFQTYVDKGKPVLQIEYPPSVSDTGKLSTSDYAFYCNTESQDNNFSKILKWASAKLDGWGQYCEGTAFRVPQLGGGY